MRDKFAKLAAGQSPETLFITCSDARVDPSLITQTDPGELFVLRNAGNIVPLPGSGDLSVEATIQYAIDVLKVHHVVICGHSRCGAVAGLLNPDSLESMPAIRDWVMRSEKALERIPCGGTCETLIPPAIEANVLQQLDHLREYECVSRALAEGRLRLHGWVYHFESGQVDFLTAFDSSSDDVGPFTEVFPSTGNEIKSPSEAVS